MNTITKLQLLDAFYTIGKDIVLDQEESDSTTSAPSSAYIKSLIADINSRIDDLNTLLGNKSDKYNSLSGYGITDAYTKSEVDSKLNTKANSSHTHDDRYFTETEINNKLNSKANTNHTHDDRYYTESEVNNLLNNKANQSTVSSIQTTVNSLNTKYINGTQIDTLSSPKQITSHGIFRYASMDVNAINSNVSSSNGKISTEDGKNGDYHAFVWDFNGNSTDGIVYGHILITSPRWEPIHAYLGRVWDGVFTGFLKIN